MHAGVLFPVHPGPAAALNLNTTHQSTGVVALSKGRGGVSPSAPQREQVNSAATHRPRANARRAKLIVMPPFRARDLRDTPDDKANTLQPSTAVFVGPLFRR